MYNSNEYENWNFNKNSKELEYLQAQNRLKESGRYNNSKEYTLRKLKLSDYTKGMFDHIK